MKVALAPAARAATSAAPTPMKLAVTLQALSWSSSGETTTIAGGDGKPLLSLACEHGAAPRLVVVRYARGERGAEALLAVQGNRQVLRLPVSAVGPDEWRGVLAASDERAEVFLGPTITATLPGGGRLELPALGPARAVIDACRAASAALPPA